MKNIGIIELKVKIPTITSRIPVSTNPERKVPNGPNMIVEKITIIASI